MLRLNTPIPLEEIKKLKTGDIVLISGTIFSFRDRAHQYLLKNNLEEIKNSLIYHCGPIVKDNRVIAAGPTTSARMNLYTPELIEKYGIRAIIGKGGMDDSVLDALKGKAVYMSAVGGAAVLYAEKMKIEAVYLEEFGMAEAIWKYTVKEFPVIVTMDSKGNSIYREILEKSKSIHNKLIK